MEKKNTLGQVPVYVTLMPTKNSSKASPTGKTTAILWSFPVTAANLSKLFKYEEKDHLTLLDRGVLYSEL